MNEIKTVKDICRRIWLFESESLIFDDFKYGPSWHMARMKAYYALAKINGVFSEPHPYKRNFAWKFKYLYRSVLSFFRSLTAFLGGAKVDVIVVEHPRTQKHNGLLIDIYSYFYAKDLENRGLNFVIFSRTLNGQFEKTDGFKRFSLDIIELLRVFFSEVLYRFINGESEVFKKCNFYLGGGVSSILKKSRVEFIYSYCIYKLLFSFYPNLKELVLVDGYSSRSGMILAAKDRGIAVVELQHGVATKYHLGYSYDEACIPKCMLRCMPDVFFVWSEFWKESLRRFFPVNIKIYTNNFFTLETEKYQNVDKDNALVIISQGAISSLLAEAVFKGVRKFDGLKVYYKLHPSEYENWLSDNNLFNISKLENFSIVKDADLYELLAKCKYQLGVFSTALFEGVALNCETILVNLPGIEYWDDFDIDFKDFESWDARDL